MSRLMTIVVAVLVVAAVGMVGCAKKGVDTSKVEKSFATSDPDTKSDVTKAVDAAKASDYSSSLAYLQKVAAKAKLTPDQQQAIDDLIAQIQKQITATANKAAGDAQKALGDATKSLGK